MPTNNFFIRQGSKQNLKINQRQNDRLLHTIGSSNYLQDAFVTSYWLPHPIDCHICHILLLVHGMVSIILDNLENQSIQWSLEGMKVSLMQLIHQSDTSLFHVAFANSCSNCLIMPKFHGSIISISNSEFLLHKNESECCTCSFWSWPYQSNCNPLARCRYNHRIHNDQNNPSANLGMTSLFKVLGQTESIG